MDQECPKPKWWEFFKRQHCLHFEANTKIVEGSCRNPQDAEIWKCCRCDFSKIVPYQIPDY